MSKIVSPYPPLLDSDESHTPAPGASWWRLRPPQNEDGNILLMETNAGGEDMTSATWCSWEFFDGHRAVIDTGFDRPTKVRIEHDFAVTYIDVLYDGPPTPSPLWRQMTPPGDYVHPDDRI